MHWDGGRVKSLEESWQSSRAAVVWNKDPCKSDSHFQGGYVAHLTIP